MSTLLIKAADRAARAHANQRRKGKDDIPYVNHCTAVATSSNADNDDAA